MRKIILASTSPRRIEYMNLTGLPYTAVAPLYEEDMTQPIPPAELVQKLSLGKAASLAPTHHDSLIVGGDTIIALSDKIYGKPKDANEAADMLFELSGKTHSALTGMTVLDTMTGRSESQVIETKVSVRPLTYDEATAYAATGEPLDKSGSYAIQGLGAVFVESIEGDYLAVLGFSLRALNELLLKFDVMMLSRS